MSFGTCGAANKTQTPQQAFDVAAEAKLRPRPSFFQEGSGPGGGAGRDAGGRAARPAAPARRASRHHACAAMARWRTLNRTNVGGASAVCVLAAHQLALATPEVPTGMVESRASGTPVGDWAPPTGSLWKAHVTPLLPTTFRLALWRGHFSFDGSAMTVRMPCMRGARTRDAWQRASIHPAACAPWACHEAVALRREPSRLQLHERQAK